MDDAYSIMKKACESIQEKEIDECSLYTDLLAVKLRALDENTRDILMHDIDNLYFRAKYSNNINSQQQLNNRNPNSNIFTTPNVPIPSTQLLSQLHPGHSFHISPQHSFPSQHSPIDVYRSRFSPVQNYYTHAFQHSQANSIISEHSTTDANASTSCD